VADEHISRSLSWSYGPTALERLLLNRFHNQLACEDTMVGDIVIGVPLNFKYYWIKFATRNVKCSAIVTL
jgi:hypothetical protein